MSTIVKHDEIEAMEGLSKTHFLNENAKRINKSLGDLAGLQKIGFHIIEVGPGHESTEHHVHLAEEECAYILSGTGVVTIDKTDHEVGPGDFIAYPAGGAAHSMRNAGAEMLRCIVVGQRLANDIVDYPRLSKRLYRHEGGNDLVDLGSIGAPTMGRKA
jgi:uncharacterized cupin superfamily protein